MARRFTGTLSIQLFTSVQLARRTDHLYPSGQVEVARNLTGLHLLLASVAIKLVCLRLPVCTHSLLERNMCAIAQNHVRQTTTTTTTINRVERDENSITRDMGHKRRIFERSFVVLLAIDFTYTKINHVTLWWPYRSYAKHHGSGLCARTHSHKYTLWQRGLQEASESLRDFFVSHRIRTRLAMRRRRGPITSYERKWLQQQQ